MEIFTSTETLGRLCDLVAPLVLILRQTWKRKIIRNLQNQQRSKNNENESVLTITIALSKIKKQNLEKYNFKIFEILLNSFKKWTKMINNTSLKWLN